MTNPTLVVLFWSTAAALAGALGVVPLIGRDQISPRWIGWSNALAAGMMLGLAYALSVETLDGVAAGLGALAGILFIYGTHVAIGAAEIDLNQLDGAPPGYGYQIFLVDFLHSASEGVAIGAAAVVDLELGLFMALAIAVHNIPEGTVLAAVQRGRGAGLPMAAGIVVAANTAQILFAVATFAVVDAAPAAAPWVEGFAVGALVNLVMVELLPESYRQAGATSIALVTAVAMVFVILGRGLMS